MSKKKIPTIWELEPHTEAKHRIFREYLKAWFPILTLSKKQFQTLLYIDGYAGPGVYKDGEDGSPIIVLREAIAHVERCKQMKWTTPIIKCLFIEKDKKRFEVLTEKLKEIDLPELVSYELVNADFRYMEEYIIEFITKHSAPAFVFIDPFGYKLSFNFIKQLMKFQSCEVFINFMYEFINRFLSRDGQQNVMKELFGTDEWVNLIGASKQEIHDFYQRNLETYVAKYVRSFEMRGKKDQTIYYLFYCTNSRKGLEKMKEAMWKVDGGGTFSFSDSTNPDQLVLFGNEPDFSQLKQEIISQFSKQTVTIEDIQDFVICKTPFLLSHIKTPVLRPMEEQGELTVLSERKRKYTYPENTRILFLV